MKTRWLETLGLLGVFGGLVFVGVEIRENTRAVEGATVQAMADSTTEMVLRGMEDPTIQAAWIPVQEGRALSEFPPPERMKLGFYFRAWLQLEQNRYTQLSLGTISSEDSLEFVSDFLTTQAFRDWWARSTSEGVSLYQPEFISYVDRRIQRSGPVRVLDRSSQR